MKIQYLLLLPCTYRMEKPEPVRLTKQMQTFLKKSCARTPRDREQRRDVLCTLLTT